MNLSHNSNKLKSGFIEILWIFIGVTIAVAFGNWNEKRKENILEKNYLELLSNEVNENQITIDRMITKYNNQIEVLKKILDLTGPNPSTISMYSFDSLLSMGMSSPNFELTNSTTDELLNSGNGNLIKDINLRILITEWNNFYKDFSSADQKVTLGHLEQYIFKVGSATSIDKASKRYTYPKDMKPETVFDLDNRRALNDPVFQNLVSDHLHSYMWYNDRYQAIKVSLDSLAVSLKTYMKN